jgi:hypothetical protein
MESEITMNFRSTYSSLVEKFKEEIREVRPENLPEPFIPVYGEDYEKHPYKIAFVGWETRGSYQLSEFLKEDLDDVLYRWREDFVESNFLLFKNYYGYSNNFGNDFWGFNLKFLAKFYAVEDWRKVKNGEHLDLLKSFIWGNMCSIERFEVTALGKGGEVAEYSKVKQASKIFDKAQHLLGVFKPNIMIVLHWQDDDDWLTEGNEDFESEKISDHLDYYYVPRTKTHVFWTAHPGWLSRKNRIDSTIDTILEVIKKKNVFPSFPGENILKRKEQKQNLLNKLKTQLTKLASEKGLNTVDENWGFDKESYFRFDIKSSEFNTAIYFCFDNWFNDFSIGLIINNKPENYELLRSEICSRLDVIGADRGWNNWAFLHYFIDDLQTWEGNDKLWDGIENGKTSERLMKIVDSILSKLEGLEL